MNTDWEKELIEFHESKGGSNGRLAGHALKFIEEAFELAFACGCSPGELAISLDKEASKHEARGFDPGSVSEETADVYGTLAVLSHHAKVNRNKAIKEKLPVVYKRDWEPDEDGVLRRPR